MHGRPVVITGIGAVTPLGLNAKDLWAGLCTGRCGIRRIRAFDPVGFTCQLAGEVGEYDIRKHVPKYHRKATKLMSRDIELSVMAANEAIADSGLVTKAAEAGGPTVDPRRFAINLGAGLISCDLRELGPSVAASITDGKFDIRRWGAAGMQTLTPLWLLKYLPNMLPCHIGIIHDIQGPSNTITCGEAGALLAIGEAAEVIARGDADVALSGGCEAKVNPIVLLRQCLLKRSTSASNDDPDHACRPFDADAQGSVFGEGAAMLVLEHLDHAISRGATIYAEVIGVGGSTSLNRSYEHPEPDGKGIEIAIQQALDEARLKGSDLDLIVPHGTGIAADDKAEAAAIAAVLGDAVETVPVWPIKSMTSHIGAASGALDAVTAAKAMQEGFVGGAVNCERKAEGCRLNISGAARRKAIRHALACSYTFGGQTAALVLRKYEG
ncbi:MAG: beta-ketoacyl-[acyl-carrier-protein] synthase family protein [Phycisphaerae bacterium]|nr:beta-ketoacyl-[acyl-carrier-protein] synthase family protein [Phycisphaerae bacterium]